MLALYSCSAGTKDRDVPAGLHGALIEGAAWQERCVAAEAATPRRHWVAGVVGEGVARGAHPQAVGQGVDRDRQARN